MDLIDNITNPRDGDIGLLPSMAVCRYNGIEWVLVSSKNLEKSGVEINEILKRREMYRRGERKYMSKEGIIMSIRPDGTDYVDKTDMPA